jgi:hypothetical protein
MHGRGPVPRAAKALSSEIEMETGSREETASKQQIGALVLL